jgi:hypothetical protein
MQRTQQGTACRIRGKADWGERYSLLSEKNPDLTLRKAENLGYGRLMIFNRETTLFLQTFEAYNGRYEVAQTASFNLQYGRDGLKLTYNSGNQKLLGLKCSKNSQCCSDKKEKP